MRIYAIGDIHGYLDQLTQAHDFINADRARVGDETAFVVHLGDLCDRGPNTKGVIDFILDGVAEGKPWRVLKGNHDRMMEWWLEDFPREDPHLRIGYHWLHNSLGGVKTLASYGVEIDPSGERTIEVHERARAAVSERHRAFLKGLPTSLQLGECLFVHAGIRPGVALDQQVEEDLVWIRAPFLDSTEDFGRLVVHGHTALDAPTMYGNRLNLDSGAGFGRPITAAVIEGREVWRLTEDGRVPIREG